MSEEKSKPIINQSIDAPNNSGTIIQTTIVNDYSTTTNLSYPKGYHSKLERPFIEFTTDQGIDIKDAFNISSLTDNGTGDYTITFVSDFPSKRYAVLPIGDTPQKFEIIGKNEGSVHIKFVEDEPEPRHVELIFRD